MRRRKPSDGASTSARNNASAAERSGPGHLRVPVEQRLAAGGAAGDQQGARHHVDPPGPGVVDALAQRDGLLDRAGHVGEGAVADVGGERVEQQVDGDGRRRPGDLAGGQAQADRRLAGPAARRRQAAAQLLAADPLDQVVGVGVLERRRRRPGRAAGRRPPPCRRRGWRRRPAAAGAPGRSGPGDSRLASSHDRAALAGAPRWAVTAAASSSALATSSSGPTAARARCQALAGEPTGMVLASARWALRRCRTRRVVVRRRAHQRVAERQPVAVERDDAVGLGDLQVADAVAELAQRRS